MTKKENAAYAAGVFDGEGYVDIYSATPPKASKNPSFMLRVIISQKDGRIMNWLQENYGGSVLMARKDKYYIYRWDIRSRAAQRFLSTILPFVLIKREQVKIALDFEEEKGRYLDSLKGYQGFRRLTPLEIDRRVMLKDRLKALKKEYVHYIKNGAATTTERKDIRKDDVTV